MGAQPLLDLKIFSVTPTRAGPPGKKKNLILPPGEIPVFTHPGTIPFFSNPQYLRD